MVWITIIIAVLVIVAIKYGYDFYKYWKFFNSLPGEKSYSLLFGNMHLLPGPKEEGFIYDEESVKKYKSFHRMWMGPFIPLIICYSPATVKTVLKSSAPKPMGGMISSPYDMGFKWLGDGLLFSNGNKWQRNRRLLTPAFHFETLKGYIGVYNECAQLLVNNMMSKKGEAFDVFPLVTNSSLDIILRTAFSYQSNCQTTSENTEYVNDLSEVMDLWIDRVYKPQLHIEWIYGLTKTGKRFYELCDKVHAFADEIIKKRKDALENGSQEENNGKTRKARDFLDTLLMARDENGDGLDQLDIRMECDTFLFEGHDTTTSGISWTLYVLSKHPEYQQKIYEEVMDVLDGREELEWSDMTKLEYTTMCIKESLRIYAAVPTIQRRLNEPLEMDGHLLPTGTFIGVHILNLHHNPHVWDNPNVYDPERFSTENHGKMDPFQFIPFSAGTRNCIGQNFAMNEMRTIISTVVKNFELKTDSDTNTRRFLSVTLKAEKEANIIAVPRQA